MRYIEVKDFRCYEHMKVELRSGVNLFIGDNGSGKTSLLKACKYALSTFFAGFSDENTKWISPKSEDFRQRAVDEETIVGERPACIIFTQDRLFDGAEGTFTVEKKSKKNSRPLLTGLLPYRDASRNLLQTYFSGKENGKVFIEKPLPLFASFSTEDIHTVRKISEEQFLDFVNKPSFGYYECLECNGLLKYWKKRLLVLAEAGKNEKETETVRTAIIDALGPDGCGIIDDMVVRPVRRKIYYHFIDGREIELDFLSDGYKRLVNIVTDLAFRCALLNKSLYGFDSAKRTKGTVIIDEIDMHLHPRLQAKVLKGLRNAFPNLQFIVATHAPMVMTGVLNDAENSVTRLNFENGEYKKASVKTYGLSASEILKLVLGVNPRDNKVDERLTELFDAIDEERYEEARVMLKSLESEFGEAIPELVQARTMLEFNTERDD